jgi:hypothetical protein
MRTAIIVGLAALVALAAPGPAVAKPRPPQVVVKTEMLGTNVPDDPFTDRIEGADADLIARARIKLTFVRRVPQTKHCAKLSYSGLDEPAKALWLLHDDGHGMPTILRPPAGPGAGVAEGCTKSSAKLAWLKQLADEPQAWTAYLDTSRALNAYTLAQGEVEVVRARG